MSNWSQVVDSYVRDEMNILDLIVGRERQVRQYGERLGTLKDTVEALREEGMSENKALYTLVERYSMDYKLIFQCYWDSRKAGDLKWLSFQLGQYHCHLFVENPFMRVDLCWEWWRDTVRGIFRRSNAKEEGQG